jgi:hypothetical protein
VDAPVTVTGLGWYAPNGGPLAVSHRVGLWDPSGSLLTSATSGGGSGRCKHDDVRPANAMPLGGAAPEGDRSRDKPSP